MPFEDHDLVAEGEDFGVLGPVADGKQPGSGQDLVVTVELVMTRADDIIGTRTAAPGTVGAAGFRRRVYGHRAAPLHLTDTIFRASDAVRVVTALISAGTVVRTPERGRLSGDVVIRLAG
jgi:hypothetical protein